MSEDGGSRRGSLTTVWPDGATLAAMDEVLDKLHLLDYEVSFCSKKSFAPVEHTLFVIAGRIAPFPIFSALVSWALSLARISFVDWEFDDPTTAANNILVELGKLGFTSDFPSSKLKPGIGPQVLHVLRFVLDQAMRAKGIRLQKPVYDLSLSNDSITAMQDDIEIDETLQIADDEEGQDDSAKFADDDDDDDAEYAELYSGALSNRSDSRNVVDQGDDMQAPTILESKVDPVEWKLELQRVTPQLKVRMVGGGKEWRTHLDSMVKHEALLNETLPDVHVQLGKIGAQVGEVAARIATQERHIQTQFAHLGSEFKEKQTKISTLTAEYSRLSGLVGSMSERLATTTDDLEALKNQLDSRSDSMTDTSPLRRIRGALNSLRDEIKRMELHTGVLRHTLLQWKIKATQHPGISMHGHTMQQSF